MFQRETVYFLDSLYLVVRQDYKYAQKMRKMGREQVDQKREG